MSGDCGPPCCVGGCCGPGSYCCGHHENDHQHDEHEFVPAEPDLLEIQSADLPGMWDHSDFIGGEGAVWSEKYQRYI